MKRKRYFKQILTAMISTTLMCSTFSCQNKTDKNKHDRSIKTRDRIENYYEYHDLDIPAGLDTVEDIRSCSGKLFIKGKKYSDVDQADFYILDNETNKPEKFIPEIDSYPTAAASKDGLIYTSSVTEDGKSVIYVHDSDNNCIRKITAADSASTAVSDITPGLQGNIYVLTNTQDGLDVSCEIIVFDCDGTLLSRTDPTAVCGISEDKKSVFSFLAAGETGDLYTVRTDTDKKSGECKGCVIFKLNELYEKQLEISDLGDICTVTNIFITQSGYLAVTGTGNVENTMHVLLIDPDTGNIEEKYDISDTDTGYRGRNEGEIIYRTAKGINSFDLYKNDQSDEESVEQSSPLICSTDSICSYDNTGSDGIRVVTDDDRIILCCERKRTYTDYIFAADNAGNITDTWPIDHEENSVVDNFCVSCNGEICYSEIRNNKAAGISPVTAGKPDYKLIIHVTDSTGAQLCRFEAGDYNSYPFVRNMACDTARIYFSLSGTGDDNNDALFIYDIDSETQHPAHTADVKDIGCKYIKSIFTAKDDTVCAVAYSPGKKISIASVSPQGDLSELDYTGLTLNDHLAFNPGSEKYDVLFSNAVSVYGYNIDTKECREVINWTDSDISCICRNPVVLDGDTIACISSADSNGAKNHESLVLLTRADESKILAVNSKKMITASSYMPDQNVISETALFNKNSDSCRIHLTDYSYHDTAEDDRKGVRSFYEDMMSGNMSDIVISSSSVSIQYAAAKGMLADLNEFIDNDDQIKRDNYLDNIFRMSSYDGKLYQIIPGFELASVIGKESCIGKDEWKFDKFSEFAESDSSTDMFYMINPADLEEKMIGPCLNEFVDYENMTCSFDNERFMKLLGFIKNNAVDSIDNDKFIKNYPDRFTSDRCRAEYVYIGGFTQFNILQNAVIQSKAKLKGLPRPDSGKSSVVYDTSISVSAASDNKEEAWQFVRGFLLDNYQMKFRDNDAPDGFPVKVSALENLRKCARDVQHNLYQFYPVNGELKDIGVISDEDIRMLADIIKNTDDKVCYDQCIMDIIIMEAEGCCRGTSSPEQTAAEIQRKVSIYLNELSNKFSFVVP